jgi:hypothetical protein
LSHTHRVDARTSPMISSAVESFYTPQLAGMMNRQDKLNVSRMFR